MGEEVKRMAEEKKGLDFEDYTLREAFSHGDWIRYEEELTRPRVEVWDAEDGWIRWVASHRGDKNLLICTPETRASPLCPIGYH
jgi:hypothetical protein